MLSCKHNTAVGNTHVLSQHRPTIAALTCLHSHNHFQAHAQPNFCMCPSHVEIYDLGVWHKPAAQWSSIPPPWVVRPLLSQLTRTPLC
jgi:hypothetical protein